MVARPSGPLERRGRCPLTASSAQVADQVTVQPGDPVATAEAERWLWDYANSRDPALRERIILAHLGLADRIASRYRHSHRTTLEDLTQTARAGLIAAVDRYDPAKGPSFVPFAVACVVGELKRYLRDTSWRLHMTRLAKEQVLRLYKAADELHQALARSPTTRELADHLHLTETQVLEAWEAAQTRIGLSLDRPAGDDADVLMGDLVAAPGPREEPEDLLALTGMIADLPDLERQVIVLRFYQDLNQDAIAVQIGHSQMQVSRLLRRALARLRAQLVEA